MELTINYNGVVKSSALSNHIKYNLEKVEQFADLGRSRVHVWLDKETSFLSRGLPAFQTKIEVKKPGIKEVFAEAKSNHLADSVNRATDRIKKRILKNKKGGQYDQKSKRSAKRVI